VAGEIHRVMKDAQDIDHIWLFGVHTEKNKMPSAISVPRDMQHAQLRRQIVALSHTVDVGARAHSRNAEKTTDR
jgi:hypothetical protein